MRKRMLEDVDGEQARNKTKHQKHAKVERLAPLDWLRYFDNAVEATTSQSLAQYKYEPPSKPDEAPRFAMLCVDQDAKQLCPIWYLRHKLRLRVEMILEITHRRHRDLENATVASGLKFIAHKGM